MKVITRVEIEVGKLVGQNHWEWIQQTIPEWNGKSICKKHIFNGEWKGSRTLHKDGEWWIFTHREDSFSNEWRFRETPNGWEWDYTTFSGLGHYSYRYKTVGYDSIKGITFEGQLTFEGRRSSLCSGNNYFRMNSGTVESWDSEREYYYTAYHKVYLVESSTPERGAWE